MVNHISSLAKSISFASTNSASAKSNVQSSDSVVVAKSAGKTTNPVATVATQKVVEPQKMQSTEQANAAKKSVDSKKADGANPPEKNQAGKNNPQTVEKTINGNAKSSAKISADKSDKQDLYTANGRLDSSAKTKVEKAKVEKAATSQENSDGAFIAGKDDVVVDIKNSDSGYNNQIYWSDDNFKTRHYIGIDNQTGSVNLGKFAEGTKIEFGIDNGQGNFFRAGSESNNADGLKHANVKQTSEGTEIGFEDLYGGGDNDFNDAVINVRSVPGDSGGKGAEGIGGSVDSIGSGKKTNRSGLGDGSNPGKGAGRTNATNQGTNNPNNKIANYLPSINSFQIDAHA